MRVEVMFGPAVLPPAEWHGRVVVVIDVLRASTTIATALSHGARAVIPLESADDVVTRSRAFERSEVILAGERKNARIEGFDLGNSPREFTREAVEGKTLLYTTSNGTNALLAVQGAREVLVGAFVNFSAVAAMVRAAARERVDLAFVCAGSDRQFSLEDTVCAGRFVRSLGRRLASATLNDAARAALTLEKKYGADLPKMFHVATHGRALAEGGYGEDLAVCATVDAHPVVPVYAERQITRLGTDRGR
ncbi:MAG: 2-phosphosulfolactate phosphatase [Gemmatimonadaceae bacterium]|nr:2-phosphosulfolactate phosphatase [Gemmatimonadaceae bacterium]